MSRHSVLFSVFPLLQSLWQTLFSLFFCTIRLQWVPKHFLLSGNDAADELAARRALLVLSSISCSLSPLTSRIHSGLFLDWRCTASSKLFDTLVPLVSTEEFVLPRHACCTLSHLRCNEHAILLGSNFTRIGRIENSSCSACVYSFQDTSYLILHRLATDYLCRSLFGDFLAFYDFWSRPWRVALFLWLHGLPPYPQLSKEVG